MRVLVTGGAGFIGSNFVELALTDQFREISSVIVLDKLTYAGKLSNLSGVEGNPNFEFIKGDICDVELVNKLVGQVDAVINFAAESHVDRSIENSTEFIKTNVLGTENVLNAAIKCEVSKVVCLSTDKAVYPINAMGISKALMEKIIIAKSRISKNTAICITRYGNVMASRGSVIPIFVEKILSGNPITVTDPSMTRFMMTLNDAVELVMYAFQHGNTGDIFIQKAPSATIETLIKSLLKVMSKPNHPIVTIGTRHGEKLYESLLSREEASIAEDLGNYYRISPDSRDLNYSKFIDEGEKINQSLQDYNSHNAERLDIDGMVNLLKKLNFIQQIIRGEKPVLD